MLETHGRSRVACRPCCRPAHAAAGAHGARASNGAGRESRREQRGVRASARTWRARRARAARFAGVFRPITGARSSRRATISATRIHRNCKPRSRGASERYDRVTLTRTLETLVDATARDQRRAGRPHDTRRSVASAIRRTAHRTRIGTMTTFLRVAAEQWPAATPAGFDLLLQLFDSTLTYRSLYPGRFEVPRADRPAGGRADQSARPVRRLRAPVHQARRDFAWRPATRDHGAFQRSDAVSRHRCRRSRRCARPTKTACYAELIRACDELGGSRQRGCA